MKSKKLELERLTEHERILLRPGMYMGALEAENTERRILDFKTNQVIKKEFKVSDGLERIFIEALSNAGDNVIRSRQYKIDPGYIEVEVTKRKVRVYNTGRTFEIKKFKKTQQYQQEIAFGKIGSSTNYNDALRYDVSGANGVGIKLTNIYSTSFELKVGDSINKKHYYQLWEQNMFKCHPPVITDYDGHSYLQIEYEANFDRFDPIYKDGYNRNIIQMLAFHCIGMSFTNRIPVKFNSIWFDYSDITIPNPMILNNKVLNGKTPDSPILDPNPMIFSCNDIISYIKRINNEVFNHKYITYSSNGGNRLPKVGVNKLVEVPNAKISLCIYDTPDEGEIISFVNGIITRDGGVHVSTVMDQIKTVVFNELNKDTKENKYKLNLRDLRPHISIVLSCFLKEPKYKSQMKDYLSSPAPIVKLNKKNLSSLMEWELINRLKRSMEAKMSRILSKTDGKARGRLLDLDKAHDAETARSKSWKERQKCILYITEGLSAKNYAMRMLKHKNGGEGIGKYSGVFPLKGKPLNVMKINLSTPDGIEKLNNNKEYIGIKKILGLKENADYKNLKERKSLRYGSIEILADSDVDGKHIVGLALTGFFRRFKALLETGYVKMHRTPVIRAYKGNQYRRFFTLNSFKKWMNRNPKGWKFKYCKGLGSSNEKDIKRDIKANLVEDISTVNLIYTSNTDIAMYTAFGEDPNVRKEWIKTYNEYEGIENIRDLKIEDFINKEMIEHPIVNTSRSIPGMDGLKESQRKIMYTALYKWKNNEEEIKTNDLVNRAVTFTNYHYGPKSLIEAVNKMALDYPGSNNMAYFGQEGMFGTRMEDGKDAAAERYTSVGKMWWWPYIFRSEDTIIYDYIYEEGKQCEPKSLLPIIPMFLVNGAWGTGTAYSTFIPNYNPVDVCRLAKAIINKQSTSQIIPWYHGFKGSIKVTTVIKKKNEKSITKNILEPDIVDYDTESKVKRRMIIQGVLTYKKDRIVVTEIPIGDSVTKYKKWLNRQIEEGRLKDYINNTDDKNIHFELIGFKNPSIKNLRLNRAFGMTNMVILDKEGKPRPFKTIKEIFEYWYQWRLEYYQKRIKIKIEHNRKRLKALKDRIVFIEAVLAGYTLKKKIPAKTILVMRESDESIQNQMDTFELDFSVYKNTSLSAISEKGIKKAQNEYEVVDEELKSLKDISAEKTWLKELDEFMVEYEKRKEESSK